MMAESDSDSDSDEAKETARGARPAPPPMLGGVPDGPEQLVRNIEAASSQREPTPIDREAFEALLAGLTDDSGSDDY